MTTGPTDGQLRVVRTGHLVELVLNRPERRNALSTELARALADACRELSADPDVRCVVLGSDCPSAFSVGADLKERHAFEVADFTRQRPVFVAAFAAVRAFPVPVIAAVHGFALGGGLELALSCDLVVADETAVLGLPEVTVGIVPGGGGTQLITRRAGSGVAADLVLTGRRLDAGEALALRLVDRLVPAGTATDAARELAGRIAGNSPVAVRQAKRALRAGLEGGLGAGLRAEDDAWRTTIASADRVEGVAAFVERRPPNWPAAPRP